MSGTDTGPTMAHKLVSAAVLGEVGPNHFWFDLNRVKRFAVVHTNDGTDHLRNNDHLEWDE